MSGSKTAVGFSFILILKVLVTFLKSKSPCILLNENINLNEKKQNKIENPKVLEKLTFCFSSYKNRKLKVKL